MAGLSIPYFVSFISNVDREASSSLLARGSPGPQLEAGLNTSLISWKKLEQMIIKVTVETHNALKSNLDEEDMYAAVNSTDLLISYDIHETADIRLRYTNFTYPCK